MMALPHMTEPIPELQRRHAAAWLAEWDVEQRLTQGDAVAAGDIISLDGDCSLDVARSPLPWRKPTSFGEGPSLVPGQIRLIAPSLLPNVTTPLYVAIISDWEDDLFLIAPFSGFQAPASRGELLVGRNEPPIAVLCPWCAASVASALLVSGSWYVDDLTSAQLGAAWHVFRHAAAGADIPEILQGRVGAPIVHPLDQRITYQRRLAAKVMPLVRMTAEHLAFMDDTPPTMIPWIRSLEKGPQSRTALAASQKAPAVARVATFDVSKRSVSLRVMLDLDGDHCTFAVLNPSGSLSSILDGSVVVTHTCVSQPLAGGQTRTSAADLARGFLLRHPDGTAAVLKNRSPG